MTCGRERDAYTDLELSDRDGAIFDQDRRTQMRTQDIPEDRSALRLAPVDAKHTHVLPKDSLYLSRSNPFVIRSY